jgi:hypothetical protein
MYDTDWMNQAACINTDPEAFFPAKGSNNHYARKICAGCPVRRDCISYALITDARDGTYGSSSNLREMWHGLYNSGRVTLDLAVDAIMAGRFPSNRVYGNSVKERREAVQV